MNIKPLGDRVLVKPLKAEEITKSGIVLPDTAENSSRHASGNANCRPARRSGMTKAMRMA